MDPTAIPTPDDLKIFIDQSITFFTIVKAVTVLIALGYLTVSAHSWDRRLLGGLALSAIVFLLSGCTINEGSTPADASIARSQAEQVAALIQGQSQQARDVANAAKDASQLTMLQQSYNEASKAQAQTQTAMALQQLQQEQAKELQAQANIQNSLVMSAAIGAINHANDHLVQTTQSWQSMNNYLLIFIAVLVTIVILGRGWLTYLNYRLQTPVGTRVLPKPTDDEEAILLFAKEVGYKIVPSPSNSKFKVVVDPNTNQYVTKGQLLLEMENASK